MSVITPGFTVKPGYFELGVSSLGGWEFSILVIAFSFTVEPKLNGKCTSHQRMSFHVAIPVADLFQTDYYTSDGPFEMYENRNCDWYEHI